ncbi:peptide deformylase [Coralliovum pocilloporae]|uniref:peptide deformylase n=1 Tax=Coralliovum pocilloporae TaxID=3066369 RepID=UPI0033076ADC
MSVLDIVKIPDDVLRQTAAPVERVDDELRRFLDDMMETMYDAPGIGLAAPQVGVLRRVVTVDVAREDEEKQPLFLVNPEIVTSSEERSTYDEGCLSIPDYYAEVERPASVTVKYLDRDGKEQQLDCEGLLATCVQHEVDHLNGVLFIDYLSKLRRDRVFKKFAKAKKLGLL